jgi:photosystem II stability/assembly factor-like uncharacterized protein
MSIAWLKRSRRPRNARPQGARFRPGLERLEDRTAPSGVPTSWSQRGAGGGGALFSPSVSPFNASELYVASDMSELFHSTDNGASWKAVDFRQIQGNHEAQVQFTEDPNVLYSMDYTSSAGVDHQRPAKSTDGGQSWHPLANDPTGDGAFKLFADPANHLRLLLSDYTTLYFSADGGTTWATRYTTTNSAAGLHLAGAFFDGANIYVGTNAGLLVSTNGGSSFGVSSVGGIPATQAILAFAGAKQNGTTRFFAVTMASGNVYAGIQGWDYGSGGQSVYTVDWGQPNWSPAMTGIAAGTEPFYVGMAHNNIGVAYIAGGSTNGTPTVYKTTTGASWSSVLQTTANQNIATGWQGASGDHQWSYGEAALGFTVAPNDANHVIITDFGFAHGSTDGGASWQAYYVAPTDRNPAGANTPRGRSYHDSGLDNTTAWGVTWADANTLVIANSDIFSTRSTDGGQTFGFGYTGPTTNSLYHVAAQGGTLYAATSSVHDLYQSTHLTDSSIDGGSGSVIFSTDKGATWQTMHNFGHVVSWVATDPTNANRLFASVVSSTAGGVYVTNDAQDGAGSVWTQLPSPPRTQGHPFDIVVLNDGTVVVSYSGRRTSNFTASSGVFVSTDHGQTWADRSDPGMQYWTKDVVVDPFDPAQNTWYAGVFSGWGGAANNLGGLYKTTDRGQHWTRVNATDRVTSVTFNPSDANEMWMTTETAGLWYSSNARAATPTFTQVASYPFRQPERVFYNPFNPSEIWVTSFGGGVMVGMVSPAGTASISGTVFVDANADGARQPAEPGLAGQTVYLDLNNNGRPDSGEPTAVTAADGSFSFANLPAGSYVVRHRPPAGAAPTGPAGGAYSVSLAAGAAVTGRDFGDVPASSVAPVVVNADLYGPHPNASADQAFVKGLYRAILGRDVDPGALTNCLSALAQGVTHAQLARILWTSAEHRGNEIDGYYLNYLGRAESPAERTAGVNAFLAGATEAALAAGFLASQEYFNLHGGTTGFVNALYLDVLGRAGDAAGVTNAVNYLNGGGSRSQLVASFVSSAEAYTRAAAGDYLAYLHRPSDAPGLQAVVNLMTSGTWGYADVAVALLGSGEFAANGQAGVP